MYRHIMYIIITLFYPSTFLNRLIIIFFLVMNIDHEHFIAFN